MKWLIELVILAMIVTASFLTYELPTWQWLTVGGCYLGSLWLGRFQGWP